MIPSVADIVQYKVLNVKYILLKEQYKYLNLLK